MDKERLITLLGISVAALAGIYIFWGPTCEKTKNKRKTKAQVPGLVNLGNTCFLNSVLQALAACPAFVLWLSNFSIKLMKSEEKKEENVENDDENPYLCRALLKTLKVLNNKHNYNATDYSPTAVINSLKANRWIISTEEQDAHELFFVLTSTLEEEITKTEVSQSFANVGSIDEVSEDDIKINFRCPREPDPVQISPFKGLLANQLMCRNCGYKCPIKCDTFDSLSLTIPSSNLGQVTLYNCLQHFVMSEVVSNVECEKCPKVLSKTKQASFFKQLTIGRLPINLCIHIQRTVWLQNGMPMKRFEHVSYPEYLIMDDFLYKHQNQQASSGFFKTLVGGCSSKSQDSAISTQQLPPLNTTSYLMQRIAEGPSIKPIRNLYQLQAVIVHLGDVFSGHFVTYRRGPTNNWFMTSDSDVKEVTFRDVISAPAYVLFYEKTSVRKEKFFEVFKNDFF